MDIMLFLLYYGIFIFMLLTYFLLRPKGVISIPDIIIIITTIVISLGGYYNSIGFRYGNNVMNYSIYFDYILFMIIVPIGLIIGSRIKIKDRIVSTLDISVNPKKIKIILFFIIIYASYYLYFIKDSVPIFMLFSGRVDNFRDIVLSRLEITHDYSENFRIPFILRYYRLILNDLMRFILSIVFLFYLQNKNKYKKLFFITLFVSIFLHVYHFEKSGLIYITLTMFFSYILYKKSSLKRNIRVYVKISIISLLLMMSMYMVFMGVSSMKDAFINMMDRAVLGQTSGIYYQDYILEAKYNNNLWGKGIPMFLLDSILDRDRVVLSKEAYSVLYPQYAARGVTGTTGGMPMFYLRSNFGYLIGTAILFIITIVTGMLNNLLRRGMKEAENKVLIVSTYSVLMIYFIQAYISDFTRVFMLPFIVSPQIMIILFTITFLKIKKTI